jgi:hypothetical protein
LLASLFYDSKFPIVQVAILTGNLSAPEVLYRLGARSSDVTSPRSAYVLHSLIAPLSLSLLNDPEHLQPMALGKDAQKKQFHSRREHYIQQSTYHNDEKYIDYC